MENTLRLVEGVKDIQLSETTIQLRDAAIKSRETAEELQGEELQGKIKLVAEELDHRVESLAKDSTDEYESASRMMIIASVVSIALGLPDRPVWCCQADQRDRSTVEQQAPNELL